MCRVKITFLFFVVCFAFSCSTLDVYEKTSSFQKHEWMANDTVRCSFKIQDTASLYNIFVVVRHSDAYRYSNMWLNVATKAPNDTFIHQQIELKLADNAKGWLGTGIDDIFAQRIRITRYPVQLKMGEYQFQVAHIMREDPLLSVLNAGIRVEKVNP